MKAAVYYETGAPDVFRYEEVPDPVAGPGDILIDVEAVSIEGAIRWTSVVKAHIDLRGEPDRIDRARGRGQL